jgi:serine phosphatase RsbU (regulator of sigma subunit)
MKLIRYAVILMLCIRAGMCLTAQEGFSDRTRALYILDIAKYVTYDESFRDKPEFIISVLDRNDQLYWELLRLAQTRKRIQDKPIRIILCARIDQIMSSSVVFVNQEDQFDIGEVLDRIKGQNTLLISEGYPFRSSMINFVVVDGEPRFEANEELMNREGLFVNELFLAQAVKTLEDWEALYERTADDLETEKGITEQQYILIEKQQDEITEQQELIRENKRILEELKSEVLERERDIEEKSKVLKSQETEIEGQKHTIAQQLTEVSSQREILAEQEKNIRVKERTILEHEEEIRKQGTTIDRQSERIILQAEAIQKQKIIIVAAGIALLLVIGLVYFIWVNYRNKQRANVLLKAQRDQIAYQKKHITDSIEYAERIQRAILPSMELFTDKLEHFVLFKPRDIVSGDFYWFEEVDDGYVIIAADCTGHGVPGAFMSMLGVSLLNEIVVNKGVTRPDEILNQLRLRIVKALKQVKEGIVKDGMDMTVCLLKPEKQTLLFSGANNPLYHIRKGMLESYKGDKMPVAIHERMEPFTLHEILLEKDDVFYMFSDGFADQFGGVNQKKFLAKNFRKLLLSLRDLPMMEQGSALDQAFEEYRGNVEQIDDVVVVGIRYR